MSAAYLNDLADRLQQVFVPMVIICGVILVVVAIYIGRAPADPPPLPAGIATMVNTGQGADMSGASSATAAPSSDSTGSDVGTYLSFLEKVDLQRRGLISSLDQALGSSQASGAAQLASQGTDIEQGFLAQKAPTSCVNLSSVYYKLLQDQMGMVSTVAAALQKGDNAGASAAASAASTQVQTDAELADTALNEAASSVNLTKPFSIVADPGAAQSAPAATTLPAPTTPPAASPTPATTTPAAPAGP